MVNLRENEVELFSWRNRLLIKSAVLNKERGLFITQNTRDTVRRTGSAMQNKGITFSMTCLILLLSRKLLGVKTRKN